MKLLAKYILLIGYTLYPLPNLNAQTFPDNFTDEMQKQFSSLSQEQKESIANQYGIKLDSSQPPDSNSTQIIDSRFQNDQLTDLTYQQNTIVSQDPYQERSNNNQFGNIENNPDQEICFDQYGNQVITNQNNEIYDYEINSLNDPREKQISQAQLQCFNQNTNNNNNETSEITDDELTRFGLSIFNKRISTFSPFEDIPVGDNYKLGAGDELVIKLVGAENNLLNASIERNGAIFIPKIGEINLAGLDFSEAVNLIKSRVNQELIGVTAYITMGRIKSINVFMAGEVNSPGMYSISALSTITQSLYQAGGISNIGSLRNIKVTRNGNEIAVFDAYDLLVYGNSKKDIRLRSGDVVLVQPYEGLVEARGSFKRTHKYEIKEGDTFGDLLKWSGGFEADAYPVKTVLSRLNSVGKIITVKNINLLKKDQLNQRLLSNDVIMIPQGGMNERKYILAEGAINRPGKYGWFEGMRVSDILSPEKDYMIDFADDTDFSIALIMRFDQLAKQYSVLDFSPLEVLNSTNPKSNLELEEFDEIYFLPNNLLDRFLLLEPFKKKLQSANTSGEQLKLFTIEGDVKFPNTYPLSENLTLEKAINIAGGASDTAFLDSVEISRVATLNGNVTSKIFEVQAAQGSIEASNFFIQSRDRVYIRKTERGMSQKSFSLEGFVNFPGTYPLNTDETLSSAIQRAGGLKSNAFPFGASLIRETLIEAQTSTNKKLASQIRTQYASSLLTSETDDASVEDIEIVAKIIESIQGEGRLVIDLDLALSGNAKYDILLEDGDIINIPQISSIVNIIGEVRNQNVVNFSEDLDTEDYLNLAGGLTQRADTDNIYIIRANGSIVSLKKSFFSLGLDKPKFIPGDTLVVPIKQNYQDPLPLWSQVTQIIYQSMVSLAAVKGL